ncbi:AI-2E family transporter [Vibrio sp. UCD-FRSSP16_10]|uniref:AI-2E family transporter n=1 Tax=unclassified Vibrio TaxID=2614977 RepID=UPI0007FC2072|nr:MULTISPECIES: AI-2E family transporter [unclassified Vibrio]OBT07931.1 AI-2E family transporter [Vibrio sp. UCD-FRSSP16_30]OBT17106.1 AI-2E family transporter [Vibrio sp. UCD-FRSSP16_10]
MNSSQDFSKQAIDAFIKIVIVGLLLFWCFQILKPFALLVVWGAIIATALFPVVKTIESKTGLSQGKSSWLLSLSAVALLILPTYLIGDSLFDTAGNIYQQVQEGTLQLKAPSESIKSWPVVGEKLYAALLGFSLNLTNTLLEYSEQIKDVLGTVASAIGSVGGSVLQFVISLLIAGVFMTNAQACEKSFQQIAVRLAGEYGTQFTQLSVATVRSVVQGVIGVAVIQSIMAGIGLYFADIPFAGLWMLAVLIVAIIQLPPILALIPALIFAWTTDSTLVAGIFTVWCVLVSASDAVLKPMLMGRGTDIPMLVILLGAIGGMAMSGIVGLFVGAVVLAVTHRLFVAWLAQSQDDVEPAVIEVDK